MPKHNGRATLNATTKKKKFLNPVTLDIQMLEKISIKNEDGAATLENSLAVSQKKLKTESYQMTQQLHSQVCAPENGNMYPQKYQQTNFLSKITHKNQRQKQPKCPFIDNQINETQDVHALEYLTIKRIKVLTPSTKWMNLW